MTRKTKLPQIQDVSADAAVPEAVRAIKEIIETRQGVRGETHDRWVTLRDLITLGLITEADLSKIT